MPPAVDEPLGPAPAPAKPSGSAGPAEPAPPLQGTPEYARRYSDRTLLALARKRAVRAGLNPAQALPSCFEGEATRPPPQGVYCSACKGRRWWIPRRPATDGTGPSGHWRCTTCRPAVGLRADQIKEIVT